MSARVAAYAEREASPDAAASPEEVCTRACGPLGWVAFRAREGRLAGLTFGWPSAAAAASALEVRSEERGTRRQTSQMTGASAGSTLSGRALIDALAERLERYGAGEMVDFDFVTLSDEHLTAFQRRVLAACRAVRHGRTTSYAGLATAVAAPRAARAVGQVMACNPFPIVVPCHRVLQSGGAIGHYSAAGGVTTKRLLLALEQVDLVGAAVGRKPR